jgi:hypothetical protein
VVTASIPLKTRIAALALASMPDCSDSGNSFQCHLDTILHFLYAAGAILAVILVVISIIAIRIYYRNRSARILNQSHRSPKA